MLLKNGINLDDKLLDFIETSNNLSIYIPYIKLAQLKHLLQSYSTIKNIILLLCFKHVKFSIFMTGVQGT